MVKKQFLECANSRLLRLKSVFKSPFSWHVDSCCLARSSPSFNLFMDAFISESRRSFWRLEKRRKKMSLGRIRFFFFESVKWVWVWEWGKNLDVLTSKRTFSHWHSSIMSITSTIIARVRSGCWTYFGGEWKWWLLWWWLGKSGKIDKQDLRFFFCVFLLLLRRRVVFGSEKRPFFFASSSEKIELVSALKSLTESERERKLLASPCIRTIQALTCIRRSEFPIRSDASSFINGESNPFSHRWIKPIFINFSMSRPKARRINQIKARNMSKNWKKRF